MPKGHRQALTVDRISAASCPPGVPQIRLWDATQPGLLVRVYASGSRTYWIRARHGGKVLWERIGDVEAIALHDARKAARIRLGTIAKGGDIKPRRSRLLEDALLAYEKSLTERGVVQRDQVLSLLRRELLKPLGNIEVAAIDLAMIVKRIDAVKSSRPGAAHELRIRAGVFLGWCAAQGITKANPMAGFRQPRQTRSQRLAEAEEVRQARILSDDEIPVFWRAAEGQGWPFGPYLQTLLLTGQRRTETAMMRWRDLDIDSGLWTIPAADTKSGREHAVPLPPELVEMLATLPKRSKCPFVFPGRDGAVLSGWSKRLKPVYAATAAEGLAPWTLHDLRRTMRSGLTALGIDQDVAEMMLNHSIGDKLRRLYDLHGAAEKRADAARMWALHVSGLLRASARAAE